MTVIKIICLLTIAGVANAQVSTTIPLSNLNGIGGFYSGHLQQPLGLGHLGAYPGDYSNLGVGLGYSQGSYLPGGLGGLPLPLNGAGLLGISGHNSALNGYGYSSAGGLLGYNGGLGYPYQGGYSGGILPFSAHGGGLIGAGHEGLVNPNGLVNPTANYRVARVAPKVVETANEILIAHGNAGTSRQWFHRIDKS